MQLQKKLRILEHADHLSHKVTLGLVAISLVALFLGNFYPDARKAESAVTELLHFVHWFALAVIVLYLVARLLLEKNVGKELASLIRDAEAYEGAISDTRKPKPAPRSGSLVITPKDIEFVASPSSPSATVLNNQNIKGFERSVSFSMTQDELIRRNSAIIDRCPKAFLLVRAGSTSPDVFMGYTCVLPLNEVGTDIYLRGLIKDKDMPASLLCHAGQPVNAILVFAIVLNERIAKSKSLKGKSFGFLLKALEYHVSTIAQEYPSVSGKLDVWVQSEDESLRTLLLARGFKSSDPKLMSADRHELLKLEFVRPAPEDQQSLQTDRPNLSSIAHQASEVVSDSQQRPMSPPNHTLKGTGKSSPPLSER